MEIRRIPVEVLGYVERDGQRHSWRVPGDKVSVRFLQRQALISCPGCWFVWVRENYGRLDRRRVWLFADRHARNCVALGQVRNQFDSASSSLIRYR